MNNFSSLILNLFLFSILQFTASEIAPTSYSGIIQRVTKQQILVSIPADSPTSTPTPFLTSPSGKYTAFLIRTPSAPTAGGFGNDFCYIQIRDSETSLWESECAPVSTSNACSLIFDDAGLEVFDGSMSVYNTQADGNHVNSLELLDEGDMRIVDKDGELAWKASDEPRNGQRCGLPGAVGLAPDSPPFADVIDGGSGSGAFGQSAQPLVDSTVFDSGSFRGVGFEWVWVVCFGAAAAMVLV